MSDNQEAPRSLFVNLRDLCGGRMLAATYPFPGAVRYDLSSESVEPEPAAWIVHSSSGPYVTTLPPIKDEPGLPRTPLYKRPTEAVGPDSSRHSFEKWLEKTYDSAAEFDVERNCYKVFAVHLAWQAWRGRSSDIDQPEKGTQ